MFTVPLDYDTIKASLRKAESLEAIPRSCVLTSKVNTCFALILLALFIISPGKAQTRPPLVLERATILNNKTIGGETVKELIGQVVISRGDMTIDCDYAVHYQKADKIIFEKKVHYADSLRDLWADKVTYFIAVDSMKAEGAVKIIQDQYEGRCHTAYYSEERENLYMHRDVRLWQKDKNVEMTGLKGFGDKTLEYAKITGVAHLVKRDSLGEVEVTIDGEVIEFFNDSSWARASDSVKIVREDVTGYCDTLHYYTESKHALMLIDPVVFRSRDEMRGDSIYMYFREEKIDRLEIFVHASAFSPPENGGAGELNKMFGRKIFIYLAEDKVDNILVQGNARSLYYLFEKEESKGINKASGDVIYLNFAEGKLETIDVSGGAEGTYYPAGWKGIVE